MVIKPKRDMPKQDDGQGEFADVSDKKFGEKRGGRGGRGGGKGRPAVAARGSYAARGRRPARARMRPISEPAVTAQVGPSRGAR